MCNFTLLAAAAGTGAALLALLLPLHEGGLWEHLRRVPKAGPVFGRLILSVQLYRRRLGALALALGLSVVVHTLLPVALSFIGAGLFSRPPSLAEHFVIVPLSLSAGAIPTPGGLGTFELAMDQLYKLLASDTDAEGTVVALAYRLITILVAAIGVVYYWTSRREVHALLQEAEAEARRDRR